MVWERYSREAIPYPDRAIRKITIHSLSDSVSFPSTYRLAQLDIFSSLLSDSIGISKKKLYSGTLSTLLGEKILKRLYSRLATSGFCMGLLAVASAVPASASLNLVQNGMFLGNPNSYLTYYAGDTFATSWMVDSGSIDWIGTYWTGPNGQLGSVDLDGSSVGSISQTINTVANGQYALTYYLNGNADGDPLVKSVKVSAGNTSMLYSQNSPSSNSDPAFENAWTKQTLLFTASSASTTITFASQDPNTGNPSFGAAIGDVSVTATPEPAFFAVLGAGFCGLVFAVKRRRVSKAVV